MKAYNCPDCHSDTCDDCSRVQPIIEHIPPYFPDSIVWPKNCQVPECCATCVNHPINGGSGVCTCTLPLYLQNSKFEAHQVGESTYVINY